MSCLLSMMMVMVKILDWRTLPFQPPTAEVKDAFWLVLILWMMMMVMMMKTMMLMDCNKFLQFGDERIMVEFCINRKFPTYDEDPYCEFHG